MKLRFLREARDEFAAAAVWYEARERGLGWRFREEVERLCREIQRHPLTWRKRRGGYSRAECAVFPYYVAFEARAEEVIVYAVAHAYRHPDYWKSRAE